MPVNLFSKNAMTSMTDDAVIVRINELAWHQGMMRAKEGGSTFDNPYALGSAEAFSWLSGFIRNGVNTAVA
ncbi:MAG: hypothetical protein RLZ25_1986 [Pseudomonadota bacterium]|jgi:hypothetical protein